MPQKSAMELLITSFIPNELEHEVSEGEVRGGIRLRKLKAGNYLFSKAERNAGSRLLTLHRVW